MSVDLRPSPSSNMSPSSEWAAYSRLLADMNAAHPQHQGFIDQAEFEAASNNPANIATQLRIEGRSLTLPQLCTVDSFAWLNAEFYRSQFGPESSMGTLMHFTEYPGVEPSTSVTDKLTDIADSNGLIVFDQPSTEPEMAKRIRHLLGGIDLCVVAEHTLGTQTYFGGEISLKREHQQRAQRLDFMAAYEDLEAGSGAEGRGVSLERVIENEADAQELYRFYAEAYKKISDHPCTQGLTPDEFSDMLLDSQITKTTFRRNGNAETMCLITDDLSQLTWVNTDWYAKKFPEKFAAQDVIWFPGIATDPDPEKAGHNVPRIMSLLARLAEHGDYEPTVVFDTPDMNTGFLDVYLNQEINAQPQTAVEFRALADQTYQAFRLARF